MKTEQKRIITISGNGKVSVPVNVQMRDFEIAELLGVMIPAVKSNIQAIIKSKVVMADTTNGATFGEYRKLFMTAPKIIDRQPVFVSRDTRDRIVRRFGERKMSVSGFLENIARQHLDHYDESFELWKKL